MQFNYNKETTIQRERHYQFERFNFYLYNLIAMLYLIWSSYHPAMTNAGFKPNQTNQQKIKRGKFHTQNQMKKILDAKK